MKQLERKLLIAYRWWRDDGNDVDQDHVDALEDIAIGRIVDGVGENLTKGTLDTRVCSGEERDFNYVADESEYVYYCGQWSVATQELV